MTPRPFRIRHGRTYYVLLCPWNADADTAAHLHAWFHHACGVRRVAQYHGTMSGTFELARVGVQETFTVAKR